MIAVVIVNYKAEALTACYVNDRVSAYFPDAIVVVVDNTPHNERELGLSDLIGAELIDGSDCCSIDLRARRFVLVAPGNVGFARGNNLGVCFVRDNFPGVEYVVLSNNDIEFDRGFDFGVISRQFEGGSDIGLIGPEVVGLDGERQSPFPYVSFWDRYFWMFWLTPFLSRERKIKRFSLDYSERAAAGVHYRIMGSFMVVRLKAFCQCGMMDPDTFLYGEEMILSERLLRCGWKTYFEPSVRVIHAHGATIGRFYDEMRRRLMMFESESIYYRKYRNVSRLEIFVGKLSLKLYLFLTRLGSFGKAVNG